MGQVNDAKIEWPMIVRISIFNKRRISQVDELSVADFEKRISGLTPSAEGIIEHTFYLITSLLVPEDASIS